MANLRMLLNRLSKNLGAVEATISIENTANDQSLNVLMETRVLRMLNITYGYELENANLIKRNFKAIDGIDLKNKIMVQVSSTVEEDKIIGTVDNIIEDGLFRDFEQLIFVGLSKKKKLTERTKKISKKKLMVGLNLMLKRILLI